MTKSFKINMQKVTNSGAKQEKKKGKMDTKIQKLNQGQFKESEFQGKVYQIVKGIRPGETMSYKEVAEAVGSPLAWRAVGNILNKNSHPEIPCHRVIRADGEIGGYNKGVKKKILLLREEGKDG